ncbi:hypothetical protein QL093DRAFT_2591076 [Fusarium oxysporum]|nr:hypothetical protein QL093DRAFT_2591076 [Fusarium oxysporum]
MYLLPLRQYRSLEAPGLIFLAAKGPTIAAILEVLDALLDRYEETARNTSRSILCWLRSTHALAGYPKPFILVYHPSSRRKYRVLFKRYLLLMFRSYSIDPSTRDRLTGIWFKRKQFWFLKDKREDNDEENITESSKEDLSQELIELLFGLSVSLYTKQCLLFLKMVLPLREYPTLELSQYLQIKQLERLKVIRKKYMAVYYRDLFYISMAEFRLLSKHIIQQTDNVFNKRGRFIDLSRLKDDLKNAEKGFSFRACSIRRGGLTVKGNWNQKAVFKYIRTEEALCEYLSLGLYHPCGQRIFVYNGSMIYLVRHHKAKRSTNREFVVVRFLPAELGQTLCQYLVFIRPFVDLLDRQCHLGFSEQGRSSPLLFRVRTISGPKPWPSGRLTTILKLATSKLWNKPVNSQLFRQLCISITEKHVREIHQPFNRFDDVSENADHNVIFAWQSGHRLLQRATTYGLDGAFPTALQPQLLESYEGASTRWHEFLHLPSKTKKFR